MVTVECVWTRRSPDWSAFDYGMHSLRIGRENDLRAADIRPELINDITSHTSMRGRQAYSRADVAELVHASRQADAAVARPVEKAVAFGQDRSAPRDAIYVDAGGSVLGGVSVVQGCVSASGVLSGAGACAPQKLEPVKRAAKQLSIAEALSKRHKG